MSTLRLAVLALVVTAMLIGPKPTDPFSNAFFPCQEDEALIHTDLPGARPSPDGIACVHLDDLEVVE